VTTRAPTLSPQDFGPPLTGGRRRTPGRLSWTRVIAVVAGFMVVAVVSATITAALLVWHGQRQITAVDVETQVPGDLDGDGGVDIPELTDLRNVLVVGSDSREGLSRRERADLGTGQFEGTRTDTIMLVQLDPQRHGAAMLSFPRDLLVTRCDGSQGRINGAYDIGASSEVGGPTCVVRTVTELTGIPVHHYVQVDFAGFVQVVDALGGVSMYLDEPIADADANIDLPAGCVRMSGQEALGFVRVRKIDSDFGRIARQQRFVRELVDQVTSARVALNLPRLFSLVEAAAKAVDTDPSLSLGVMRQIAFSFRDIRSDRIDARTVPAFNRVISGAAYVVADEARAEALFAAFREGVAAPADVGTEGPSDVRVADVPPLVVLNATNISGLATAATHALQARGFAVESTANADRSDAGRTVIEHPQDRREEAELVRELFPGALIRRAADATTVTVYVGADTDPERLAAMAEEEPTPTGPPEPEPEPTFAGAAPPETPKDC